MSYDWGGSPLIKQKKVTFDHMFGAGALRETRQQPDCDEVKKTSHDVREHLAWGGTYWKVNYER